LLMDFINFLNEAKGVQIIRKVGGDSPYNDPLDVGYTYANYVTFGYGGVVIEPENPKYYNVNDFIRAIERKYSFYLEKYREEKEKRNQEAARKAREEREREMAPRRQRYDKFMEAYKLWCSKDAYWHMANRKKLPIPEKFGVTEEDLEKFGYYSAAAKNQRLEDYRNASRKYEYGNSALKGLFTGGKRRPIPEDYGLESSEVDHLSVGQLLNEGRGR